MWQEAMGELATTVSLAGLGIFVLGNMVERVFGGRPHRVELRLRSGKVIILDLDRGLSTARRSELVRAALQSADAGDEVGLRQVMEDSHTESARTRAH